MRKVIKNEVEQSGEVLLYDTIGGDWFGGGVTAKSFAEAVTELGDVKTITLRINSPGGQVWDGLAMYNTLNAHPAKKIVVIEGLAASAASFVAMVGDEIKMAENAIFMIHLAQIFSMGDRNQFAKDIEMLTKHDETIATTYAARSGKDAGYFMALMEKETWMSAEEAKGHGLVTDILPAKRIEACAGPECNIAKAFKKIPAKALVFFNKSNSVCGEEFTYQEWSDAGGKCPACGSTNIQSPEDKKGTPMKKNCTCGAKNDAATMSAPTEEKPKEEKPKMAVCPDCEGTGKIGEETCATCNGTGEVPEKPPEEPTPENAACPECSGDGECSQCGGSGMIEGGVCTGCEGSGECYLCDGSGKVQDAVAARLKKIDRDAVRARLAEIGV